MIPELGHFALIIALGFALIQVVIPLMGVYQKNISLMKLSQYTAVGQFVFVGMSFISLSLCFVSNDFSVMYVAKNSNTALPLFYRFCALWGAHEGSLLLWVFILSIWTFLVSQFSSRLPMDLLARVLAVMGMISIGFYLFMLMTSDPFLRYLPNFPNNGADLNPILQDPGLAIHPPMLYMGYVGFSVAFAFAIAALMSGKCDAAWVRWSKPWTLMAWCFLTFGIVLGSWWAYRELGWGGFWFWDPVENASFLPWLVGTALIHSMAVSEKRNIFKAWTVLLAIFAFSLSLLGTFLVRSGVLISVHAFAVDPKRGLFILEFLFLVIGGPLSLYAVKANKIISSNYFYIFSKESLLLANNILLFSAMTTVLLGTLYPLIMSALNFQKLSVGAPYFNSVFIPIMFPLIFLMGMAPYFHWHFFDIRKIRYRLFILFIFSLLLSILLPWIVGVYFKWEVLVGLCLAFWILFNLLFKKHTLTSFLNNMPMFLAHAGMAVTIIGVVLTTAYNQERDLTMKIGEKANIGPYEFQLVAMNYLQGPNYISDEATIILSNKNREIAKLHPELREFLVQHLMTSKVDIQANIFRDLYVALGQKLQDSSWEFRIYYKPFVRWIWAGGLLMIIGGLFSLMHRKFRGAYE